MMGERGGRSIAASMFRHWSGKLLPLAAAA